MSNLNPDDINARGSESPDRQSALHRIRAAVESVLPESQIILFGSHVRGDFDGASDYDLLIMTQESIDVRKKNATENQDTEAASGTGDFL